MYITSQIIHKDAMEMRILQTGLYRATSTHTYAHICVCMYARAYVYLHVYIKKKKEKRRSKIFISKRIGAHISIYLYIITAAFLDKEFYPVAIPITVNHRKGPEGCNERSDMVWEGAGGVRRRRRRR